MIFFIISIINFKVVRFLVVRILKLDIETNKSVFFYTGTFIGLLLAILKFAIEVGGVLS